MAKNIYSLQLLRNGAAYASKTAAYDALQSASGLADVTKKDGVAVLARYIHTEGEGGSQVKQIRTLVGYYAEASAMTETSEATSYMTIIDVEGSAADVEELRNMIGTGVTTANTVTKQLQDLSGTTADTSATTSVAGAKKYADEKIAQAVDALDYTDTAVAGQYVSQVTETDGVIAVTRAELPTVAAISEAGKPITAVSESLGSVSATAGTINAEFVNVADGGNLFTGSTVEAVLAEIDAAYKAADAAIVDNASETANTLAKLEDIVNDLSADAATYTIRKDTASLPAEIKERYTLVETKNGQSTDKQVTIDIPKDSHIVSITYITGSTDPHYQNLEYVYVDVSGNTQTTYVDMSQLVLESEFASGVTSTNGVVHGVVDPSSETNSGGTAFLTVGADGFKVAGIKQEIIDRINELDASVTGGTTAGTATFDHIQVVVDEVDGKLTAVTVTEANIADADDLAALSAKTVTEVASSNNSITAALSAATDGTKHLDIITDASKIQMSGFTAAESGFTAIAQSSSVTEAFKAVETYVLENEETVSAALNDLEETKVENINVNGVEGTFSNKVASVTIDGADIKLDGYTSGSSSAAVVATDTVNQAIGKLENQVKAAVAGGLQAVESGNGISVSAVANNKQTISVNLKENVTTSGSEWENPLKFDSNGGLYFDSLDCGTY